MFGFGIAIALLSLTCMVSTSGSVRPQCGAIYARYSTDFQNSIEDQIRECKVWAAANNVVVPDDMIFIDRGVTGKRSKRPGSDALLDRFDEIDVVITLRTCRMFRNLQETLKFIGENILDKNKRIVFVSQDLDTGKDDRWRYLIPVLGMMDESRLYSGNASIQAAHKGIGRVTQSGPVPVLVWRGE